MVKIKKKNKAKTNFGNKSQKPVKASPPVEEKDQISSASEKDPGKFF